MASKISGLSSVDIAVIRACMLDLPLPDNLPARYQTSSSSSSSSSSTPKSSISSSSASSTTTPTPSARRSSQTPADYRDEVCHKGKHWILTVGDCTDDCCRRQQRPKDQLQYGGNHRDHRQTTANPLFGQHLSQAQRPARAQTQTQTQTQTSAQAQAQQSGGRGRRLNDYEHSHPQPPSPYPPHHNFDIPADPAHTTPPTTTVVPVPATPEKEEEQEQDDEQQQQQQRQKKQEEQQQQQQERKSLLAKERDRIGKAAMAASKWAPAS